MSAELIGLQALALAKYMEHVEEIKQKVLKEKIRRTLQLESDLQHKIKEFNLKPGSLVLVKNLAIELSADRKIKARYLRPMVIIHCLKGRAFILAELGGSVWQNKVMAFRIIPYLSRKKISYEKEVKRLLDMLEESIKALKDKQETSDLDITREGRDKE